MDGLDENMIAVLDICSKDPGMSLDRISANNIYMMCGCLVDSHVDMADLCTARRVFCITFTCIET